MLRRLAKRGALVALCATVAPPLAARAAGLEDTVGGALGLGRAASFARVNDFMATWQNPANLAVIPGGDLGIELRLSWLKACYDRAYDPTVEYKRPTPELDYRGTESVANVCNEGPPGPGGNFGWAQSFDSGWGYGVGFFLPAVGAASTKWGNDTIVSLLPRPDERYPPTLEGVEAPTRQMGIERTGRFGGYLMAGLGWAPLPQLRLGASAGVGALSFSMKSAASVLKSTFLDQEIVQEMTVTDYAIPRALFALVLSPFERRGRSLEQAIELFGTLTYQGDFHGRGHIDVIANGIQGEPRADCEGDDPGTHCRHDGIRVEARFPTWEVTFGMRMAQRRPGHARTLNPLKDEVWDLEMDANWAKTSHVDAVRLVAYDADLDPAERPRVQLSSSDDPGVRSYNLPQRAAAQLRWMDTWTVRVGGDYNVIRDRLALRAGISYATRAAPIEYMNTAAWPVRKVGLHAGVTVGFGRYRLTGAYTHLFFEPIEVPVGAGKLTEPVGLNDQTALAINEGYYQGSLDVVSLQFNVGF
jgi:hypothetical protein